MRVAALFVDPVGPYFGTDYVDPWDESRDARLYNGSDPVVAHPPCERWGRFAEGSPTNKGFKLGDDGGCFESALRNVRRVGGVIEHPNGSHAFHRFGLPIPTLEPRWTPADRFGGRSTCVDQGAYGHKAKKSTWLYAVLPDFPKMNWKRVSGLPYIGGDGFHSSRERQRAKARADYKPKPQIPVGENHLTPLDFAVELARLAESCRGWTPTERQIQPTLFAIEAEPKAG